MSQAEGVPERYYPRVYMEFDLSAALQHALRPLLASEYAVHGNRLAARSPIFVPRYGVEVNGDPQEAVYGAIHGDFRRLGARFEVHEVSPKIIAARAQDPEASFCRHALVCIGLGERQQAELQTIMTPHSDALRPAPARPVQLAIGIPSAQLRRGLTRDEYSAKVRRIDQQAKVGVQQQALSPYYVYGHPRVRVDRRG